MPEQICKVFDTPVGGKLIVENFKGSITVTGWDRLQTEIAVTPHQDGTEVEISQHDGTIIARTKTEQGPGKWLNPFGGSRTPRVDYVVSAPSETDLELKNVEGPIAVHGSEGEIRIHTVDGKVTIEEAEGDVQAETVNGALLANRLRGKAQLKSVNGKLTLEDGALSSLTAQTVNGKIRAAATWDTDAQISLHTVNGDCMLVVPVDFRAKASAHGVNVSVTIGEGETVLRQFTGWRGAIGPEGDLEPQAEIAFHTVNGHLHIDNSGAATGSAERSVKVTPETEAPSPPTTFSEFKAPQAPSGEAPADAAPPKTQLDVLQMVERGEISVEQALEILED
jgi:hypothetical protein